MMAEKRLAERWAKKEEVQFAGRSSRAPEGVLRDASHNASI